jgi:hypothetical protein
MEDKVDAFIQDFLAHYTSEYYDPVKAREYYLRTRELKGRRSGSDLKSDKKKQAWAYAKEKITTERDEIIKEGGAELKMDVEIMRQEALRKREQLSGLLKDLLKKATEIRQSDANVISERQKKESERISKRAENEKERISKNAKRESERLSKLQTRMSERISEQASQKIAALPPIPKGISAERRAELAAERSKEIAKIRGTADKERKSLSDSVKTERGSIAAEAKLQRDAVTKEANAQKEALSKKTSAQREGLSKWSKDDKDKHRTRVGSEKTAIRDGLKAAVDQGRAGYKKAKERIKADYEAKLDAEYEAIKKNV